MELDQLRAFASLARTRNFSRTAEILHLVQSTISVRIRALENSLGKPLFERTRRSVELTEAGRAFLPFAERILSLCDESAAEMKAFEAYEGRLGVGGADSAWRYLLRPVLTEYARRHPRVSLVTKTARSSQIVQMVADGIIEIGFSYSRPRLPGLVAAPVFDDSVVLVAAATHRAAKLGRLTRDRLAELPLLYCDWDGPIREWLARILPHGYFSPLYPDQLSLLVTLLEKGHGAGYVPHFAVADELSRGSLVELRTARDLSPPRRILYAISKKGARENARVNEWLAVMKELGFRAPKRGV